MHKGFTQWLLSEDSVPANAVGTSGAVAGLDTNPPVNRRRKRNNPILAALQRNKPLTTKRRPHPIVAAARKTLGREEPVTEITAPSPRKLGELLETADRLQHGIRFPCGGWKLCHQCNRPGIGYCLLGTTVGVMH